ncbi:6,7-dimethyl-8-ribityllumazine synthase [soil metagenome]
MNQRKPTEISAPLNAKGMKFAIVVSRFNAFVTKELLSGALDAIERLGGSAGDQLVVWAPGGFEIPLIAKTLLEKGGIDGVIALGCVMKGATPHDQYIAAEAAKGCSMLALQYSKPVSFGILTPETLEQALERAGMKMGNKGSEAAIAAIEVVALQKLLA